MIQPPICCLRPGRPGLSLAVLATVCALTWSLAPARAAEHSGESVVWDSWYTVTVNRDVHYSYYIEKVTKDKDKQLHFLNHVWKRDGEFINEEQLGALARDDAYVTPVFFNFHSNYRTTETTIDGNVREGRLTVKVKQGDKDLPIVTRAMPKDVILSVFFPVWLGKKLSTFKRVGDTKSFDTILEDNVDLGFATVIGNARLEKPDETAIRTKTHKFAVNYRDIRTYWWVDSKGMAVRIEMPEQHMTVERVTEQKAERFLKDIPGSASSNDEARAGEYGSGGSR